MIDKVIILEIIIKRKIMWVRRFKQSQIVQL